MSSDNTLVAVGFIHVLQEILELNFSLYGLRRHFASEQESLNHSSPLPRTISARERSWFMADDEDFSFLTNPHVYSHFFLLK